MQTKRHRILQDPVETEAIVTHIGESNSRVGPTIYYKYQWLHPAGELLPRS